MEYRVRVWTAMHGDTVPLIYVATAMARHAATDYGTLPLHMPTLENLRPDRELLLLKAVDSGHLTVCDCHGVVVSAKELVETAKALAAELAGTELAEAVEAKDILPFIYAKRQHLIDWGKAFGDSFLFEETPGTMTHSDLRNFSETGHGEIIEAGFYRNHVGGGESEPWQDTRLGMMPATSGSTQIIAMTAAVEDVGALGGAGRFQRPRAKRRNWKDVAWPYLKATFTAGQYATAKDFYKALEMKAGEGSPFEVGTGPNRGSLFVREISKPFTLKTLQNTAWPDLTAGR